MQIFTVGSLTLDIFFEPEEQNILKKGAKELITFELGSKVRVRDTRQLFGGSSMNTAVAVRRLGLSSVACVGAVGDDLIARDVLQNLKREKIATRFVSKLSGTQTGFSLIVKPTNGRHVALVNSGANHDFCRLKQDIFHHCAALHLGRLSGDSCHVFETIRRFFKKNPEKLLSWNPGKEQIQKGIRHFRDFLPVVDILLLNLEEAETFTGVQARGSDATFRGAKHLTPIFRDIAANKFSGVCLITDGARGTQASDGEQIFFVPPYRKFEIVDTLGAGDAFAATFFAAHILGHDIADSLKFASVNSASVVSAIGAHTALLPLSKLKKLGRGVRVSRKKI